MSLFHRLAHFQAPPLVKVGDWVLRGKTVLGNVGSTGNSTGPHCHYDIQNRRPTKFTSYVEGMNKAQVQNLYVNPKPFVKNGLPLANSLPLAGYGYLEYVPNGGYYHPGMDLNSINDLGKPIYAPCNGRVVYVGGKTTLNNLMSKVLPKSLNSGWGYFVVIEQDPKFFINEVA